MDEPKTAGDAAMIELDLAGIAHATCAAMLADLPQRARTLAQLCTESPHADALSAYSATLLVAFFAVGSTAEFEALRNRLEEAHTVIKTVTQYDDD